MKTKLNLALHNFLMQYRYANANDSQSGPYPDTRQFVAGATRADASRAAVLHHGRFESIVLYDNKAVTATVTPTPDKKYKVTLTVQARKFKSDGAGETPMALNDYIDIGVFTGKKDEEKPLSLKKEKITQEKQTFEIVVDQMPTAPESIRTTNSSIGSRMTISWILPNNKSHISTTTFPTALDSTRAYAEAISAVEKRCSLRSGLSLPASTNSAA